MSQVDFLKIVYTWYVISTSSFGNNRQTLCTPHRAYIQQTLQLSGWQMNSHALNYAGLAGIPTACVFWMNKEKS